MVNFLLKGQLLTKYRLWTSQFILLYTIIDRLNEIPRPFKVQEVSFPQD